MVEVVQLCHHFGDLDCGVLAHFELCTKSGMFAISVVEHIHTKFGGHVEAVVGTNVDAHLACRTCFPNDTNAPVVVARHKEPRLHVFKAFVRVLHGLWFPQRRLQVGRDSVGCELLPADVVHRGRRGCSCSTSIIKELRVRGVVVSPQFFAKALADEREGSQRCDQCDLKRVPKQVSEIRLCVWMHWHGLHLTPVPGLPSPLVCPCGRGTCVPD